MNRPGCASEPFTGKFSLSLFFSLAISHFGLSSQVSSLRLSLGHAGQVLTLSTDYAAHASLSCPCSLVVDMSLWAISLLAVVVRHIPVMLPSEIPRLPTEPPVRGFPTVWKLLCLHDSLSRMNLHSKHFCLSFCVLYFVLDPFKENGLPFWVPGVFHQHSEIVLWKFLSIQMIF